MNHFKRNINKRIIQSVGTFVLCAVYLGGIYWLDHAFEKSKQQECDETVQSDFNKLVSSLEYELSQCKRPAVNFIKRIELDHNIDFRNEEKVYQALEDMVSNNDLLSGAIMGFEDWVYPQYADRNGFGPLVRRQYHGLSRLQIGEFRDFRKENEWYQRQLKDPKPEWSKPFLSDDGVMITTFTIPLFDNDRYMGGFGIDIDLSRIAESIEKFCPYPGSIVVVVDEDLNILMHPNQEYIGRITLDEAMRRIGIDPSSHGLIHSHDRLPGVEYDYLGHRHTAFYYAPVTQTNWMVILYCPTDEVYGSVEKVHLVFVIMAVVGFILFSCLLGYFIYQLVRDYNQYYYSGRNGNYYED